MKTLFYRLTALAVLLTLGISLFAQDLAGFREKKDLFSETIQYGFPLYRQYGGNISLDKLLTEAQPEPAPQPIPPSSSDDSGSSAGAIVCYVLGGTTAGLGLLFALLGGIFMAIGSDVGEGFLWAGVGMAGGGGLLALLGLAFE